MQRNYSISKIALYAVAVFIAVFVILYHPVNLFCYDVFGYYMYLPLTFNYHDLFMHNPATIEGIFAKYKVSETFYQAFRWEHTNTWVMRYPIGIAILLSPFYFLANLISYFTSYPNDGFSLPYQISILTGCYVYTLIGLIYARKALLLFFKDGTVAITLFAIVLGTNYFFHVSMHGQGAMSHNFIFTLIACFIYFSIKWHKTPSLKNAIILGLLLGLITISRATEIIVVIIPFLYGVYNIETLKQKLIFILKNRMKIVYAFIAFLSVLSVQLLYWKMATGKLFINAYGCSNPGEGLEPLHPHILEILFSFRKGLFIYVPLMLFAFIGFFKLKKFLQPMQVAIIFYCIITFYIVSCWSCWWYGSCFGNRALIPAYAFLSFPLASFFESAFLSRVKYVVSALLLLLVSLNLFQSWQMHKGIMDTTNMSRSYYFSTFLQTSPPTAEQKKLLLPGRFDSGVEIFTKDDSLSHQQTLNQCLNMSSLNNVEKYTAKEGNLYVLKTCTLNSVVKNLSNKSNFWIRVSVYLYKTTDTISQPAKMGVYLKHKGYEFKNMSMVILLNEQQSQTIKKYQFYFWIPDDLRSTNDEVVMYLSGNKGQLFYVKDFCYEVLEPIKDKSVF